MLQGQCHCHRRPERLAKIDQATNIHLVARGSIRPGCARIGHQALLRWTAGIPAIAAVIKEQDREAGLIESGRKRRAE